MNFNCTIQELKPERCSHMGDLRRFQLHHTGIKTNMVQHFLRVVVGDFNCTIQELKHIQQGVRRLYLYHFNCTIQELKHGFSKLIK